MSKTTPHSMFVDAQERAREQLATSRAERAAIATSRALAPKTGPCGHEACYIKPYCIMGGLGACTHKACQVKPHCRYGSGLRSIANASRAAHRAGVVVSPPQSTPTGDTGDPIRRLRKQHRDLLIDINDLERRFESDPSVFPDEHHDELDALRIDAGKLERQIGKMTRAMTELAPLRDALAALARV